jgi:hypothetical protein
MGAAAMEEVGTASPNRPLAPTEESIIYFYFYFLIWSLESLAASQAESIKQ